MTFFQQQLESKMTSTVPLFKIDVDKFRQVYEFSQIDATPKQRAMVASFPMSITPAMLEPANVDPRTADLDFMFKCFFPWHGVGADLPFGPDFNESKASRRERAIGIYDMRFDKRTEHEFLVDLGVMIRGIHARLCNRASCTGANCRSDFGVFWDQLCAHQSHERERMVRRVAEDMDIASTHDFDDLATMVRPLSTFCLRQRPPPSPPADAPASPMLMGEVGESDRFEINTNDVGTPLYVSDEESDDIEIISVKY